MKVTLRKEYDGRAVLNLSGLVFEEGKITAVLGESGAGKTTLLHVLAGLTKAEGSAEGVGRVSMLFQEPALLPNLTAEGNLRFVLPKNEWGKIPSMLARVGLAGKERALPHTLSGGERQRVAIARAFLFEHDTLLMDEPFSSLDLSLRRQLYALVTQLWQERGSTVIFVTHDVREALQLASRALVLKRGEVTFDLPLSAPYPRDFLGEYPEERVLIGALLGE